MAIPDLTNTYVAANYRKATAPFTRFGTRELAFYVIWVYGYDDNYLTDQVNGGTVNGYDATIERQFDSNSVMAGLLQAIQTKAELYAVGAVDTTGYGGGSTASWFTIGVSRDTYKDGNDDNYELPGTSPGSNSIADVIDEYLSVQDDLGNWAYDGLDVYRTALIGDYFDNFGTSWAVARKDAAKVSQTPASAMKVNARAAAKKAALKK